MKFECAWCGDKLREAVKYKEEIVVSISHGICNKCFHVELKKALDYKDNLPTS